MNEEQIMWANKIIRHLQSDKRVKASYNLEGVFDIPEDGDNDFDIAIEWLVYEDLMQESSGRHFITPKGRDINSVDDYIIIKNKLIHREIDEAEINRRKNRYWWTEHPIIANLICAAIGFILGLFVKVVSEMITKLL